MPQHRRGIASTQFGKQVTRGRTCCASNHTMPHVYRFLQEHASHTLALDCRSGYWTWSVNMGTNSEPHIDKLNLCSYLLALPADSLVYLTQGDSEQQLGATYRRFDATQKHHVHCNNRRITLSCFYLRQDQQQQIYTRSVQVYYQDTSAHTRITGPHQPTVQTLAESALRQLGLPDHLEDHSYTCRVAGRPVHNTFLLPEGCQLQLLLQPKAPGVRYLPLAPSFKGGGDSDKGQGLGKILQAVKAVDCRWTNVQIKHLLNDKFKEIIATGDQQKLKQHLDKESKKLGMQPKGQVIPDAPAQPPPPQQEQRKGNKGKGGKQQTKGQSKSQQPKEVKTVALPAGAFQVAGNTLPDTAAVLQDYRRLQSSQHTQVLITSAKGKKPEELPEPTLEGVELLITENGRTHTALLNVYVWHLAGPKAKISQAARIIDMGPASTITVKLSPTQYIKQEARTPPAQYTVKTVRQFIKTIDPQLDVKIQDIWQPALLAHDDAFVIRIAKENAHQALSRLTRHGFATTPQRAWQQDMGVIWLQDRTYADATRAATQTLAAVPEENDCTGIAACSSDRARKKQHTDSGCPRTT
eukprot:4625614-Amphidinium_carterae.1